jgi:uncharacterized protein YfiM (DUF2279 family)
LYNRVTAVFGHFKMLANIFILVGLVFQAGFAMGQDSKPAETDSSLSAQNLSHRDDWLGKDKLDHAMVSAGLVAAQFYFLHTEQDWKRPKSRQIAAASTLVIGIAKEIYDGLTRRGTASWKDLLADFVGIGLAFVLFTQ